MKVDLIIKGGYVYNSYFKKFLLGDIVVYKDKVIHIGDTYDTYNQRFQCENVIDARGKYIVPGLIDIHMHIESSMTIPSEFSKTAIKYGVTTVVADPHEIANVFGIDGIREFLKYKGAMDIFYGIPSSVPSTSKDFETTGGSILLKDVEELLNEDDILCLGEVMNFKDLIEDENSDINKIIDLAKKTKKNFPLEGHCPKISGVDLSLYIYRGVDGDHTQQTVKSIEEKISKGMFIEIQHKSMTKENVEFLIDNNLYEHFCLATDDVMADKLLEGHLNKLLIHAVELGMSIENAIYVSSFTPARRMGLLDRGSIAPGKIADFMIIDNLETFDIEAVFKNGKEVYHRGGGERKEILKDSNKCALKSNNSFERFYNSIKLNELAEDDFRVSYVCDNKNVGNYNEINIANISENSNELNNIKLYEDSHSLKNEKVLCRTMNVAENTTFTSEGEVELKLKGENLLWENNDCALITVFERYGKSKNKAFGLVQGDILKRGAVATTWAHDHHNLMVMGYSASDVVLAANKVIAMGGGYAVVDNGEVIAELPLPIGGIVSDKPIEEVGEGLKKVRQALKKLGYNHMNEIMSFSTLSLPVSPALKITDKGLIDVKKQEIISLFK